MATTQTDDAIEELTRPVIKLLVALVGLFILRFIVGRLPGVGRVIMDPFLTVAAIASAIITLVMVGIIVNFGLEIEPRLNAVLDGPTDVVQDIAEIVKYLTFVIGIYFAHGGLQGVANNFLFDVNSGMLIYDIAFLLIALLPTVIIALRIYNNIDEITDVLTQQVKSATVQEVRCPSCSESVRASLDYCPNCGETVPGDTSTTGPSTSRCPECNTDVDPGMEFCGSCGSDLSTAD